MVFMTMRKKGKSLFLRETGYIGRAANMARFAFEGKGRDNRYLRVARMCRGFDHKCGFALLWGK